MLKTYIFMARWPKQPKQHCAFFKRGAVIAESPEQAEKLIRADNSFNGVETVAITELQAGLVVLQAG